MIKATVNEMLRINAGVGQLMRVPNKGAELTMAVTTMIVALKAPLDAYQSCADGLFAEHINEDERARVQELPEEEREDTWENMPGRKELDAELEKLGREEVTILCKPLRSSMFKDGIDVDEGTLLTLAMNGALILEDLEEAEEADEE